MKRVGFVGLGIMGAGMAGQLLEQGFELVVWNRDRSKAQPLVERGAKLAASPAELASEVEVVITMVRDDAAVREVLLGENGAIAAAKPGTTFIDMSTVTPGMTRELLQATDAKGCHYLDSPVTGSKAAAASGQLNLLVGGKAEDIEAQRDVLETMAGTITHIGPNGSSAFFKLANNQLAAVLLATYGECLALIEAAGIDRAMALETLIGTAARVSGMKKDKILKGDFSTDFALDLMHKDLTQAMQAANEVGLPAPILAATREVYQQARKEGKGGQDFAVIAVK
ncbi:MAG TPA: NAD(P)-dependent oxidoreductase [Chloroflexia bacterium]|nr:NAD(P)-dependent oxidoreductase [Chloroflexia bacterium]